MKNKSILIAIVIMVATAIIGSVFLHSIDSISAKERLLSMINTVSPIQSMRIDTEGSIWINFPDELKKLMANSPLQYDKMKINGFTECIYNPQNLQILSQQSTDISGMKMDTSIFINHDEIFIKYPLLGDALYASIDDRLSFCVEDCGYTDAFEALKYRAKNDYTKVVGAFTWLNVWIIKQPRHRKPKFMQCLQRRDRTRATTNMQENSFAHNCNPPDFREPSV